MSLPTSNSAPIAAQPITLIQNRGQLQQAPNFAGALAGNAVANYPSGIISPQSNIAFADPSLTMAANTSTFMDSFTVTITSSLSADTSILLFNTFDYTNQVTGGGSIIYSWSDGTTQGQVISNLLGTARQSVGGLLAGAQFQISNSSTGGLTTVGGIISPNFLWRNMLGTQTSLPLNLATNFTRGDFSDSIYVSQFLANVNKSCQMALTMPGTARATSSTGTTNTLQITFYTNNDYKR